MSTELVTTQPFSDLSAIEQLPTLSAAASHVAADLDDRSMMDWSPLPASPDADLDQYELGTMVGRSRDMYRNNGVAAGGLQTLKDNIIGATLRLSAKPDYLLLGKDFAWAKEWSRNTEAQFRSWADTTECDAGRSLNLLGLSLQILSGAFQNGDGLALPIFKQRPGSRWGTRMHVIESDRLATPPGMESKKYLSGGVQQDQHGEPLSYWIMKNHPGDKWGMHFWQSTPDQWTNIPAYTSWGRRRVIHLHDKERAGQSRAKPIIAAVMREFKMAGKYTTTELQTAIANSLIAAVLESDLDAESMNAILAAGQSTNANVSAEEAKFNQLMGGYRSKLQGGAILKTPPGTKMHLLSAGRNNAAFEQYMNSVLRYIAAGLNMPYELLMKDFSQTNYSSARAALLEAWRYFNGRRRWLSDYWLSAVYELWLEEAINLGRVEAPDFYENKYAYTRCRWIMSGRGWVDPVKEANGSKIKMEIGLSTLENECAEQGLDWEEVLEQTAYENQRRDELNIPRLGAVQYAPVAAEPDNDESVSGDSAGKDKKGIGASRELGAISEEEIQYA